MKRNLALNLALVIVSVVLVTVVLLSVPERAPELLTVIIVSTSLTLVALWRSNVDAKKDERSMQLMSLGARNSFIFLLFAMPWLAAFHMVGIITLDAGLVLLFLWVLSLGIAWLTFFYYDRR